MLKIQIIGHLGSDVKNINTSEKPFIAFNVAEQGVDKDRTTWVDCTMSYTHAAGVPKVAEFLKKGKQVYVEGRPITKIFTLTDGTTKSGIGILVEKIELCGSVEKEV